MTNSATPQANSSEQEEVTQAIFGLIFMDDTCGRENYGISH